MTYKHAETIGTNIEHFKVKFSVLIETACFYSLQNAFKFTNSASL